MPTIEPIPYKKPATSSPARLALAERLYIELLQSRPVMIPQNCAKMAFQLADVFESSERET